MAYQPIDDYGIIGNMRSVALVSKNASIDWFCFPYFDSPSIFARLIDDEKGGYFDIRPRHERFKTRQLYWPDTNVLITRFLSNEGIVEITDYMPVGDDINEEKDYRIVRRIKGVHGKVPLCMHCHPAFNYGQDEHKVHIADEGVVFESEKLSMVLTSTSKLEREENGCMTEFDVCEGETYVFVFHKAFDNENPVAVSKEEADSRFVNTINYWRNWLHKSTYTGRWREIINRSALVLKLMTFEPTGAIVAAPTCSLPESFDSNRNWDYRYSWIRDAAFTVHAFLRIGFAQEAAKFINWIIKRCEETDENDTLQVMYGINGEKELHETLLSHLAGYKDSQPVRIGNDAWDQLQLDIYGELMDAVYQFDTYAEPISYHAWKSLIKHIDWLADHWHEKDESIWELRNGRRHFVYSKLMCWVAFDRTIKIAQRRSFPAELSKYYKIRNQIYKDIIGKGWNEKLQSFMQAYDSDVLDASILMMSMTLFMSPTDPMMLKTIETIRKSPKNGGLVSNSLVYRYNPQAKDGITGEEGTFNICTFWLVDALTRAGSINRELLGEARLIFEQMLGYANHVGVYSEQIGLNGDFLGNMPQALTHVGLINSACTLNKALDNEL